MFCWCLEFCPLPQHRLQLAIVTTCSSRRAPGVLQIEEQSSRFTRTTMRGRVRRSCQPSLHTAHISALPAHGPPSRAPGRTHNSSWDKKHHRPSPFRSESKGWGDEREGALPPVATHRKFSVLWSGVYMTNI